MNLSQGTLAERIRMDRVDPREKLEEQMQLLEQDAEAQRSTKDRRKAGTMKDLWNHDPRKGEYPRIARRRRTERPLGSPPGAEGRMAEPLCRQLEEQTWEKTTSLGKVQL